eukprot:TRINITY_DN21086_c0_g1_i2.p1 TRINITY_DN21086_c0_g1~~TRINITY_DN21086_c0_g1_i2.p1  ORF type:complete len:871 (+),score=128.21 TRINITY_DN21086_c0_g1_i2:27-2615(+)
MPGPHTQYLSYNQRLEQRFICIEQRLEQFSGLLGENKVLERLVSLEKQVASFDAQCAAAGEEPKRIEMNSSKEDEDEIADTSLARRKQMSRVSSGLLDEETEENYVFGESVWDIAVFIGTDVLGTAGSIQTMVLVVISILMQVVFVMIAYFNFLEPQLSQATIDDISAWRTSSGHDLLSYDPVTGSSLTARVCAKDGSLSVSGSQMTLYEEIEAYLQSDTDSELQGIFDGQLLCIVALVCWFLMVAKEMNRALALHRATISVPIGPNKIAPNSTAHYVIHSLTRARRLVCWVILLYRTLAAVILIYVGIHFLVNTISVEDLILNAVALGIILDIDDLIFDALATTPSRHLVRCLVPLPMKSFPRIKGTDMKSFAMLACLVALLVYIQCFMLVPMSDRLLDLQGALCGGNRDFVWAKDAQSFVWTAPTKPFAERAVMQVNDVGHRAIKESLRSSYPSTSAWNHSQWNFALWKADVASLREQQAMDRAMLSTDTNPLCEDLASVRRPYLAYLQEILGNNSINSCSDAIQFCNLFEVSGEKGFKTRMLCSRTCGCAEPDSTNILLSGCPKDACRASESYRSKLEAGFCAEDAPSSLRKNSVWSGWVDQLRSIARSDVHFAGRPQLAQLADAMWDHGCGFGTNLTNQSVSWGSCAAWNPSFRWDFKSPAFLCPISCRCHNPPAKTAGSCPTPENDCHDWWLSRAMHGDFSVQVQNYTQLDTNSMMQAALKDSAEEMLLQALDIGAYQFTIQITLRLTRLLNNSDNYPATRRLADAQLKFYICASNEHYWDKAIAEFEDTTEQQMTSMIIAGMQARGIDTDALGISVIHGTKGTNVPEDSELPKDEDLEDNIEKWCLKTAEALDDGE